jgi:hypothetical protein
MTVVHVHVHVHTFIVGVDLRWCWLFGVASHDGKQNLGFFNYLVIRTARS